MYPNIYLNQKQLKPLSYIFIIFAYVFYVLVSLRTSFSFRQAMRMYKVHKRNSLVKGYIHKYSLPKYFYKSKYYYGHILQKISHKFQYLFVHHYKIKLLTSLNYNFFKILVIYIILVMLLLIVYNRLYIYEGSYNLKFTIMKLISIQGVTGISMYFLVLGLVNISYTDRSLGTFLSIIITPTVFTLFLVSTIIQIDPLFSSNIDFFNE